MPQPPPPSLAWPAMAANPLLRHQLLPLLRHQHLPPACACSAEERRSAAGAWRGTGPAANSAEFEIIVVAEPANLWARGEWVCECGCGCVCVCVCVCVWGDGRHLPIVGAICAARELAAFAHISWDGDLSLLHYLAARPLTCWAAIDGNCQQPLLPRRLGSAWGGLSLHLSR